MSLRILHVSDLHTGARHSTQDATFGLALAALIEQVDPALVVASGDLAHRGTAAQQIHAAQFLHGLGRPLLVVPGNHDVAYTLPGRLTHPWRSFRSVWETTEPVVSAPGLHAVGLNSACPLRHQGGWLGPKALARAVARLQGGEAGALRVAVLHHPLTGAPLRARKRPLPRRRTVLERLAAAGVELVLGGHIHQVSVCEGREFLNLERGVLLATAPGLARPRPRRRGEACGALVYTVEPQTIRVDSHLWQEPSFAPIATRLFARGEGRLAEHA
jgi:3',5'-cyclic AMP phosphodiesterase CpdA